jgi:HK97 family phage portal protein
VIISKAFNPPTQAATSGEPEKPTPASYSRFSRFSNQRTKAKRTVTPELFQTISTAYRAKNLLSDGIAKMPLQLFQLVREKKERVRPDSRARNNPYLIEVSPNRWGWTPFLFKKNMADWLILYGNSYIWSPPAWPFQKYILPADRTYPVFDEDGDLWYATILTTNGKLDYIPGAEVMHNLINPDATGHVGRGVIEFARETGGRQIAAYDTESQIMASGLSSKVILQVAATLDEGKREEYRQSYAKQMSADGPGVAVLDNRITKFEPVTIKPVDVQFLGMVEANDEDIARFFGIPLHMLYMGKEAYNSNEQQYLEYLNESLDPYLVQLEQSARISWLPAKQQDDHFWKFNRSALLRMDGKTRAEMNEILIRSGQRSPDETRDKDDYSPIADGSGQKYYMTKNYAPIDELGEEQ